MTTTIKKIISLKVFRIWFDAFFSRNFNHERLKLFRKHRNINNKYNLY